MKKIYALQGFLFLSVLSASGQFETGQKVIGGNVAFLISGSKSVQSGNYTYNNTIFSINPSFGKFVKPNLLYGAELSYGYSYQKSMPPDSTPGTKTYNYSLSIGLFSQRFFPLAKKIFLTLSTSVSAGYNSGSFRYLQGGATYLKEDGYSINLSLAPGFSYWLTSRFLFDVYLSNLINVGYSHSRTRYQTIPLNTSYNAFNLSSSLSNTALGNVGLGFRWLLKK